MEFKDRLRLLREERQKSAAQLAGEFEKSEGAIRMWETGKSKPDADTLIALAKYFNCTTDYLLGLSDYKNAAQLKKLDDSLHWLVRTINRAASPETTARNMRVIYDAAYLIDGEDGMKYSDIILDLLGQAALSIAANQHTHYDKRDDALVKYAVVVNKVEARRRLLYSAISAFFTRAITLNMNKALSADHCDEHFDALIRSLSQGLIDKYNYYDVNELYEAMHTIDASDTDSDALAWIISQIEKKNPTND